MDKLLALVISIIITNNISVNSYGRYSYVMALIAIFTVVSNIGARGLVIKKIVHYQNGNDAAGLKGIVLTFFTVSLVVSVLSIGLIQTWLFFQDGDYSEVRGLVYILPVIAAILLSSQVLRGARFVILPFVPDKLVRPLLFLGLLFFWSTTVETFDVDYVIYSFAIAIGAAGIVSIFLVFRKVTVKTGGEKPRFEFREWLQSAIPVFTASIVQVLNARVEYFIILFLLSAREVALYAVAIRIAMSVNILEISIRSWSAPIVADLIQKKKMEALQNHISRITRFTFGLTLLLGIVVVLFNEQILSLFGLAYLGAKSILILLLILQLINVMFMYNNNLLLMSDGEKVYLKWNIIQLMVGCVLITLLGSVFNLIGIAYGLVLTTLVINIARFIEIRKRLGISCFII